MKVSSFAFLALAAKAVALPSTPLGRRMSEDLEGQEHHMVGDDNHEEAVTAPLMVGSAYLARRQVKPLAIIQSITPAVTVTAKVSATLAIAQTTTARASTTTTIRTTTTTTRSTTASAQGAVQTINVTGMTYQNAMLISHNVHRTNHSIVQLVWDQNLANIAQDIAKNCVYGHNVTADGGGYGQNIGAGAAGNAAAGLITNLMYNAEIGYYPLPYGNDNPPLNNFSLWGHYSQLVWSDTTNVGCYTQYCPNGLANTGPGVAPYFTVCNYSPPGNYVGEFSSVAAPGGGQTVVIVGS